MAIFTERILLVDGDQGTLDPIIEILKAEAPLCAVELASNGQLASDKLVTFKPTVVILEMMLFRRSGFSVIEDIKKAGERGELKRPIIIMITYNPGSRHKQYALSLGVDDYILKPFKLEKLMASINKAIETRDAQKTK